MRLLVVCLAALILTGSAQATTIYVTNGSTQVSDAQLADALPAFQAALDQDFQPAWGTTATLTQAVDPPARSWQINLTDAPSCWFCAGYHDVVGGAPHAEVGVEGNWQVTFTHELFEMAADPWINQGMLVSPRKGVKKWYALEVSDPVEADALAYTRKSASGADVVISDFIFPSWFRRGSRGPWDQAGAIRKPLQVLAFGYQLVYGPGGWQDERVTGKNVSGLR